LGLLLHFGTYDLSLLPAARNYNKPLILNRVLMEKFTEAFVPGMSSDEIKHPSVSPYYEDLEPFRGQLPSALFTCGTDDPLLDDSVNMGTKWMMFGGDAIVKIYPGCPHTFIRFPANILEEAGKALMDTKTYIQACMARS
jgi:acetyl esterase/lipase